MEVILMQESTKENIFIILINLGFISFFPIALFITSLDPPPPYVLYIASTVSIITSNGILHIFEMLADLYLLFYPIVLFISLLNIIFLDIW